MLGVYYTLIVILIHQAVLGAQFPECNRLSDKLADGMTIRESWLKNEDFIAFADSTLYKSMKIGKKQFYARKTYMRTDQIKIAAQIDAKIRKRIGKADWRIDTQGCYEDEVRRNVYTLIEPFRVTMDVDARVGDLGQKLRKKDPKRYLYYKKLFKILSELHNQKIYLNGFNLDAFALIDTPKEEDQVRILTFHTAIDMKDEPEESCMELDNETNKKYNKYEVDDVRKACVNLAQIEYGTEDIENVEPHEDYEAGKAPLIQDFDEKAINLARTTQMANKKLGYLPKNPEKSFHGFLVACLVKDVTKVPTAKKLAEILDKLSVFTGAKEKGFFNFF